MKRHSLHISILALGLLFSALWASSVFAQDAEDLDAVLDDLLGPAAVVEDVAVDVEMQVPKARPVVEIDEDAVALALLLPSLRTEPPAYIAVPDLRDEELAQSSPLLPTVVERPDAPLAAPLVDVANAAVPSAPAGMQNVLLGRPNPAVQAQMRRVGEIQGTPEFDPGCPARLRQLGVEFEFVPDEVRGFCPVAGIVEVSSFPGINLLPSGSEMTCDMAERTAKWLRNSVQGEAMQQFGQPLTALRHYSAYSCRRRGGGKISEHGFGNALDVAVFQLADGSKFNLAENWNSDGTDFGRRASTFLRRVGDHACDEFQVVLTPDSDAAHFNHFHFDAGPWKSCG